MTLSYRCSICAELHEDIPDIGADKPDHYFSVPDEERDKRIELTPDTCIIDHEDFFLRGVIEIPILDHPQTFGFGVWVSQKRENFYTYLNNYDSSEIGPFFGWLCTRIAYYEVDTLTLKTSVHFRIGGQRPGIELEPTDHPLSMDQSNGITMEKAWDIVHFYLDLGKEGVQ